MAENTEPDEIIKCTVTCPECGGEIVCTHEDARHEGTHRCAQGHEWA